MPSKNYFMRQAATLLRFARQTGDPKVAAVLIEKAAELNEKIDDPASPPLDLGPHAPDVERRK